MATGPHPTLAWDVRTADVDAVRRTVAGLFKPFELLTRPHRAYRAGLYCRPVGRATLAVIEYGDRVSLRAAALQDLVLVQLPVRGSFRAGSGRHATEVRTGSAQIVLPDAPVVMEWSPDCQALVVRFDDPAAVAALLGARPAAARREPRRPVVVPLHAGGGRSLGRILGFLQDELADGLLHAVAPELRRQADALLLAYASVALQGASPGTGDAATVPGCVRRAEDYIEANLAAAPDLAGIVRAGGASARTLFAGFARVHGMGPMAWLRWRRLQRTQAELLAAAPGETSVTAIALRWGFTHLGRYASSYRHCFGESPSATLQRRSSGR